MLKKFLISGMIISSYLYADVVSMPDKYLTEELNNKTVKNLSLKSGWNLVSLNGYSEKNIDEIFNSDKIIQIYIYRDNNWFLYKPNSFNNIDTISPSDGIWVEVKDEKQYNISFGVSIETTNNGNCETNPVTGETVCGEATTTSDESNCGYDPFGNPISCDDDSFLVPPSSEAPSPTSTTTSSGNNCYENPFTGEVTCNSNSTTTSGYGSTTTSSGNNCGLPGMPACNDNSTSTTSSGYILPFL